MDVGSLTNGLMQKLHDVTVNYQPSPNTLDKNKNKILIGAATLGGAYALPGDHPILVTLALGYTALKCYQSIRDWAGK
jgi:hypothetical protein